MVHLDVKPHEKFPGIFWVDTETGARKLATKNLTLGRSVYGERLIRSNYTEYRLWDPYRSKLAAAILKQLRTNPIKPGQRILYLGSATGTTVSHVSDIIGENGKAYCVEFSARAMREFVDNLCSYRENLYPILADARFPDKYPTLVGSVDVVYSDVAQVEQAKILADNADKHLKAEGWVMIAVKSRSIDVTKSPSDVFKGEMQVLKNRGFKLLEAVRLEPYERDHALIIAQKRSNQ
jgi:fibrillarin-like pre-rRNA processing protein